MFLPKKTLQKFTKVTVSDILRPGKNVAKFFSGKAKRGDRCVIPRLHKGFTLRLPIIIPQLSTKN
jgi:hypothetical protein